MGNYWQRLRWAWHEVHGGVLMRVQDDGSVSWRCLCGATLGTTDLTQDGRND